MDKHIFSFGPAVSHDRRKHAPKGLHLSPGFNITNMHNDFRTENPSAKISYEFYRKRVNAHNISFVKLGEEECESCDLQDKHTEGDHPEENDDQYCAQELIYTQKRKTERKVFESCDTCDTFSKHISMANISRLECKKVRFGGT